MRYEERVLAFIDVLGFEKAVENTIEKVDGNEIEKIPEIQKINNLLDEIRQYTIMSSFLSGELDIKDRIVSQISDSVVISYSKESNFCHILHDAYFLCVKALQIGFLLRGAIVCGKVIHIENENKLFGPAFLKAYNMEREKAIFPRIIIDSNFLDIAQANLSTCSDPNTEYNDLKRLILEDFDGISFVNYFDKLYTGVNIGIKGEQEHLMWLSENLKTLEEKMTEDVRIKCKYLWFKEKYNSRFSIFKNKYCSDNAK